jgi:hypothetical protein
MKLQHLNPALVLLWIAVAVFAVNTALVWDWELDDALIYARYIDNFTEGNGLVFNSGIKVNGLTSPLFAYLSILVVPFVDDAKNAIMLVSALAVVGSMLVFYKLLARFFIEKKAAAISALLATMAAASYVNLGMETSLFVLLFGVCLYCYLKNAHILLGVAVGFLVLTRPEGLLLVPVLAINTFLRGRHWPSWYCYLMPAAMIAFQLLFNGLYYGEILPTSGVAKLYQGESGLWAEEQFLSTLLTKFHFGFTATGNWLSMFVLLMCAACSMLVTRANEYLILTALFLVFYTVFYVVLKIPPQGWYYGIYFSILWSYVAIGVAGIVEQVSGKSDKTANRLYGLPLVILFFTFFWQEPKLRDTVGGTVRQDYRAIGVWLASNTPNNASIALVEIGTVAWYSEREIIDILGLVTPEVGEFIARGELSAWTDVYQPDYMLVHEPLWELEVGLYALMERSTVTEVTEFEFPGFRLKQVVE